MNRLMIFDLDGVLFETRDMHYDTLNAALERAGFTPITREEHLNRYNGLPTASKLMMLGIHGQDAEEVKREKQASTLAWVGKNVKTDQALVSLFCDLHADGWGIAVASNALTMTVLKALQNLGLWPLVDYMCGNDMVVHPKPHPEMYLRCMEVMGMRPEQTWVVEDSPYGVQAARDCGAHVISVEGPAQVADAVHLVMTEVS